MHIQESPGIPTCTNLKLAIISLFSKIYHDPDGNQMKGYIGVSGRVCDAKNVIKGY